MEMLEQSRELVMKRAEKEGVYFGHLAQFKVSH